MDGWRSEPGREHGDDEILQLTQFAAQPKTCIGAAITNAELDVVLIATEHASRAEGGGGATTEGRGGNYGIVTGAVLVREISSASCIAITPTRTCVPDASPVGSAPRVRSKRGAARSATRAISVRSGERNTTV